MFRGRNSDKGQGQAQNYDRFIQCIFVSLWMDPFGGRMGRRVKGIQPMPKYSEDCREATKADALELGYNK